MQGIDYSDFGPNSNSEMDGMNQDSLIYLAGNAWHSGEFAAATIALHMSLAKAYHRQRHPPAAEGSAGQAPPVAETQVDLLDVTSNADEAFKVLDSLVA